MELGEIMLGTEPGWGSILISVPLLYAAIVVYVRLSGKRSTTQMNNFDWIVTVAIGSLVGSAAIVKDVGVLPALLAIGLLFTLQFVLTWLVIRSEKVARLVKSAPNLLLYKGEYVESALRKERVSKREVLSAVRDADYWHLDEVEAVILEPDGKFSVLPVPSQPLSSESSHVLSECQGFPPDTKPSEKSSTRAT